MFADASNFMNYQHSESESEKSLTGFWWEKPTFLFWLLCSFHIIIVSAPPDVLFPFNMLGVPYSENNIWLMFLSFFLFLFQWNLVCDSAWKVHIAKFSLLVGSIFGYLVMGVMADWYAASFFVCFVRL